MHAVAFFSRGDIGNVVSLCVGLVRYKQNISGTKAHAKLASLTTSWDKKNLPSNQGNLFEIQWGACIDFHGASLENNETAFSYTVGEGGTWNEEEAMLLAMQSYASAVIH
jgi:hypothetical protein